MGIKDKLIKGTLGELRNEILEEYPHGREVELREVASVHFVAWYALTQKEDNLVDLQSTIEDFEQWILEGS